MKKTVYAAFGLLILCGSAFGAPAKADVQADTAALLAMEAKWDTAAVKGDIAAFDALYADNYVFTSSEGTVQTKAEVQRELSSGDLKYLTSKADVTKVFLYGDAAVVIGKWTGKYVFKGQTKETRESYTCLYVRQQNGRWQMAASQSGHIKQANQSTGL